MRINKYRGRRSYDKKWIYGSLLIDNNGDFHILESNIIEKDGHHIYIDSDSPMFFDNDTIGQFTGLHDKKRTEEYPNGQPIYEGDCIFVTDDDGNSGMVDTGVGEIEFVDGGWYVCGNVQNDLFNINRRFQIEVIGNIHERSENDDK